MRASRGFAATIVITAAALAGRAEAQSSSPPFDPDIDVQLFEYSIGPKTFFSVSDATGAAPGALVGDAMFTYLANPFTIYNVSPDDKIEDKRTRVVASMLAVELSAAYGITDALQVGAALPVVGGRGDGLDPATASPGMEPLAIQGLGDLRIEGKYRFVEAGGLRVAVAGGLTVPSSLIGNQDFIGDDMPSGRLRLAVQQTFSDGKVSLGVNLGAIVRKPHELYAARIGQQATFGAAASFHLTDVLSVIAESYGRTGFENFLDVDSSPVEAIGGLRFQATPGMIVVVGGGGGVVRGIGSPTWRAFASVGWAPDVRDTDHDGVPNAEDRCSLVPEDKDDWEDRDGCPEDDNDNDRREDTADKCPNQAEDLDGFEDEDGCPELDNDNDGIVDLSDRCPRDPEDRKGPSPKDGCPINKRDTDGDGTMDSDDQCPDQEEDLDGFEDWDGCPDPDQDKDGVADGDDKCPLCPEDKDGFGDDDGCPETDADADGIVDTKDKCGNEAEVINGIDDFDGCPDEGGAVVVNLEGDRLTFVRPPGFDRKGLNRAGEVILDQAALVMLQQRDVSLWLVAVAAPKKGDAEKQAKWIRQRLEQRGVPAKSLQVLASAGETKVGIVVRGRLEGEALAPVCPAGKEVVPRAQPVRPVDAPAAASDAPATKPPATPKTTPAAPKATPAKPDAKPETTPAAPKATPAKPDAKPETPAAPKATPAKPDAKPAKPGATPAKPGATPPKTPPKNEESGAIMDELK